MRPLDWLVEQGIVVGLGHTEASQTQAAAAFAAGARLLTHTFNAMLLLCTTALQDPLPRPAWRPNQCSCGLIADGVHVAPAVAVLLTPHGARPGWCL